MRKLVVLGVVLGALLAADVAARAWAESKLAEQMATYYPPAASSEASIRSFPFLGRLLVFGDVQGASVRMENLRYEALTVPRFEIDLDDVQLDRSQLLAGAVEVLDVGAGRIEALVDGASLARVTGLDLRFGAGEVEVHQTVRGVDVSARGRVTLEGNQLRIVPTSVQGLGLPASAFAVTYDIPGVELLPCAAQAQVVAEGILVSCAVDDIPPALVRSAAAAALAAHR